MPKKYPIIHEKAVVAVGTTWENPVGEALRKRDPLPISPMTPQERQDLVDRLENSIFTLMDEAEATYQEDSLKHANPNYITRLSTNEFFFYTKEPLTLKEFEELQNKIAEKAKTLSAGVQLILGSFAVKTDNNKVMNVTPHITCGNPPNVHLIVKSYTSGIDVRYKIPDGFGNTTTLAVLDKLKSNPEMPMPQIMIDRTTKKFTFNNIVPCKTPGGVEFLTVIDICLDHHYGVGREHYKNLARKNPSILKTPVSHVVVSNCVDLETNKCIGSAIMHVDPVCSPIICKSGVRQAQGPSRKLAFGNGTFRMFDVDGERVHLLIEHVKNDYAYRTLSHSAGRDHKFYTVSLDKVKFQKSQNAQDFQEFKNKYQTKKGDHLKTQILEDLRSRIEETTTKIELADLKKELMNSYEMDVLKTGQGWFTQKFGIKTSSQKVLENMFEQQEKYLSSVGPNSRLSN